jgi:hypothetical protein
MPGSTQRDTEQLFNKEDVAQAALTGRINAMRPFAPFRYTSASFVFISRLPFSAQARIRPGKGKGKGGPQRRSAFRHGAKGKGKGRGTAPASQHTPTTPFSQLRLEPGRAGASTGQRHSGEQGVSARRPSSQPQPSSQSGRETAMVAAERNPRCGGPDHSRSASRLAIAARAEQEASAEDRPGGGRSPQGTGGIRSSGRCHSSGPCPGSPFAPMVSHHPTNPLRAKSASHFRRQGTQWFFSSQFIL